MVFFIHFSLGLLRITPFVGPWISALAIAWSRAIEASFRDLLAHNELSITSCQCGRYLGLFHRIVALLIPIELRATMSLFSMSLLSASDKAVQSAMGRSITRLQPGRKSPEIQRDPALLGTTIRTNVNVLRNVT